MNEDQAKADARRRIDAAQQIHEVARQYRGRFLNLVANIEHDLAHLLADYFCPADHGKRDIIYSELFAGGGFSLNQKKALFLEIVRKDYPLYWDENKPILDAFAIVQRFRNKLAHSKVNVDEAILLRPIAEGVGFTDWEGGAPITQQEFDGYNAKATMILTCIAEVRRLLPFKQRPVNDGAS